MKAAWFETFGPARDTIVVGQQPEPRPKNGEVLVKLLISGVNPSDVKKRAGAFQGLLDEGFIIPHSDGAGTIEAVGEGVSRDRIGQRVWVYQSQFGRRFGTCAEYVALDDFRAAALPENASFEVGSCMGIPAMTAHRCVFADGPVEGKKIVVTGGAGRVGYYAIQWAKSAGATVIATASSLVDEQACREVGADEVVNHRESGWGDRILKITGSDKVDRLVDVEFGANLEEVLKFIRTGGTIATYSSTQVKEPKLPYLQMMFMDLTIRMVIVYAMPESAKIDAINDITRYLSEDRLQHRIADTYSLSDTWRAHELIERGKVRGCVLVDVNS